MPAMFKPTADNVALAIVGLAGWVLLGVFLFTPVAMFLR